MTATVHAKSSQGAAVPSMEAEALPSQLQKSIRSPRRKKPQRQSSSSGPPTRSQDNPSRHLGCPQSSPTSQQSSDADRTQAPVTSPDSQHNSSSSRDATAQNSFQTFAVGRRFHPTAKVEAGQAAMLQHQESNAKDPNALMVVTCEEPRQVLGYLPATVAAILVSVVKEDCAGVAVTILERPKTPKASLLISVQVNPA